MILLWLFFMYICFYCDFFVEFVIDIYVFVYVLFNMEVGIWYIFV